MKTNDLTHTPRERTSVFITGVDTSTPDDLVKDGMCEELHNMRYEGSAWRPTHPYNAIKEGISLPLTATIVYHHPAVGEGKYITEFQRVGVDGSTYNYALFDINTGESTSIITLTEQAKVSHFGNVLIFIGNTITYSLFKDGKYLPIKLNLDLPYINIAYADKKAYTTPHIYWKVDKQITLGTDYPIPANVYHSAFSQGGYNIFNDVVDYVKKHSSGVSLQLTVASMLHNFDGAYNPPLSIDGRWCGNVCFIVAYRMADGSIIQTSPLNLISRDTPYNISNIFKGKLYGKDAYSSATFETKDTFVWAETTLPLSTSDTSSTDISLEDSRLAHFTYYTPEISISIPQSVLNAEVVESIAIYATHINNAFDIDSFETIQDSSSIIDAYNKKSIVDQPLYLVKDIPLSQVKEKGGSISLNLTSIDLNRAINNEVYVPNILDSIKGETLLDFNNRLHVADTTTTIGDTPHFQKPFSVDPTKPDVKVSIASGIEVKTPNGLVRFAFPYNLCHEAFAFSYSRILSFPDTSITAFLSHVSSDSHVARYEATKSFANNFAFYTAPPTKEFQFPPLSAKRSGVIDISSLISSSTSFREPNRLQVSSTNNSFAYSFDNVYRIGSITNRILALQSAAIEMSDAKFGEMPLYAFTTEGIFALQAGAQTLYSNVIPINYDKIINPNTLAINGAIAYITEKGVHLLTNQGTQVISTPIHNKDNTPPLDFLRVCKMIYPKEHNEIVLLNEKSITGVAYVYNLDAGYWSTRDLKGIKLNTDELYYDNTLYDLANEDESKALSVEIITRPIKLGDVEFKRLETIIPRMATTTEDVLMDMYVDGSVDGKYYRPLRKLQAFNIDPDSVNPVVLRRTPFSAKYFTCKMQLDVAPDETTFNASITHIDFEWYRKLRHRMR